MPVARKSRSKALGNAVSSAGSYSGDAPDSNDVVVGPTDITFFDDKADGIVGPTRVRIYREDDKTKKWTFHGWLATDLASEPLVAETFGGGRWVAQRIIMEESGKQGIKGTKPFVIPGNYVPRSGPLPGIGDAFAPSPNPSPAVQMSAGPSSQQDLRSLMESAMMTRMMDMVNKTPVTPPTDWAGIIAAGATLVKVLPDLLAKKDTTGQSLLMQTLQEIRTEVAAVKDRPSPQSANMKDLLDVLKGVAEVREVVNGGTGEEPEGGSQLLSIAGKVLDMIRGGVGAPPPPMQDPSVVGQIPAAMPSQVPPWQTLLREYGPRLVDAAQRDVETDLAAPMVVRYMAENQKGTLRELLAAPNVAEVIVQVVPAMANHPTWLASFVEEMRIELFGGVEKEEEPEAEEMPET